MCERVAGKGDQWSKGATVSVLLDTDNQQAFLLNSKQSTPISSLNINLLEEVDNMNYCEVITTENCHEDANTVWLKQGDVRAYTETPDYKWFARMTVGSFFVEFRQVHKTTGVVREYSVKTSVLQLPAGTAVAGTNAYAYYLYSTLQLVPAKGSNHLCWHFGGHRYTFTASNAARYHSRCSGIVTEDGRTVLLQSQGGTDKTYYQHEFTTYKDAIYRDGYIYFCRHNGANGYCSVTLECYDVETLTKQNTETLAKDGFCSLGAYFLEESDSPVLTIFTYDKSTYRPYVLCYKDITPTSAGSCTEAGGTNYVAKVNYTDTTAAFHSGCFMEDGGKVSLLVASYTSGHGVSTTGMCINRVTYNTETGNIASGEILSFGTNTTLLYRIMFAPGRHDRNLAFISLTANDMYGARDRTIMVDLKNGKTKLVPMCVSACAIGPYAVSVTTHPEGGSHVVSPRDSEGVACMRVEGKRIIYLDNYGNYGTIEDIDEFLDGGHPNSREQIWTCPANGTYKFIAVGGGDYGGTSYGGGSGHLKIATAQLSEGDEVKITIGGGGMYTSLPAHELLDDSGLAQATVVEGVTFALPGHLSKGGANGYPTSDGGGGGGYNLIDYGGNGQPSTILPSKNGGQGSMPAQGYGAGGSAGNQPGRDGCVVIIK